jgi:hypothetical protein
MNNEPDRMNNKQERPSALWLIEAAIRSLRRQGVTTAAGLAGALNDQGITTATGDRWQARWVQRIMANGTTERGRPK